MTRDTHPVASVATAILLVTSVIGGVVVLGTTGYTGSTHDGVAEAAAGDKNWNTTLGGIVGASPTVAGGSVYIGANSGHLYSVDASTGSIEWNKTVDGTVEGAPAVSDSYVFAATDAGTMYAVDPSTGDTKWTYSAGNAMRDSPTFVNGTIYIGDSGGTVHAIDASSGSAEWTRTHSGSAFTSATVKDGTVYIGNKDNNVYALSASDGAKQWNYTAGDFVLSSPTVANGVVYVGSHDNNVHAIDASTGSQEWTYTTGQSVGSSPTVNNGTVYVGSSDNDLYALDAGTGSLDWSYTTGGSVTSSPTVASGTVYVGDSLDSFHAVDASTGNATWTYTGSNDFGSSPTVKDGTVYVGSDDNDVYAFDTAHTKSSIGTRVSLGTLGHIGALSSASTSLEISGTVRDQNGAPVAGAQVSVKGVNTHVSASNFPQIDGVSVKDMFGTAPPVPFQDQVESLEGFEPDSFNIDEDSFSDPVVLMHNEEDWDAEAVPDWAFATDQLYDESPPEDVTPRPVVSADATPVFACWQPADPTGPDWLRQDSVDRSIPGMETGGCSEIEVTQLSSAGTSWDAPKTYSPKEIYTSERFPGVTAKTHRVVRPESIPPGVYSVKPAGAPDSRAITYGVAPDSTASNIPALADTSDVKDAANQAGEKFAYKQVETDENGRFTVSFSDSSGINHADVTAHKAGEKLNVTQPTQEDVVADFESAVSSSFRDAAGTSLDDASDEQFRETCREMESVADTHGVPYFGSTETTVPNQDVVVTGYRVDIPGADQAVIDCATRNLAEDILNGDLSSILPSFLDTADLETRFRHLQRLLSANDQLLQRVDEGSDADIESLIEKDPSTIDDPTLEEAVNDGFGEIDSGEDPEDTNRNPSSFDWYGGGSGGSPTYPAPPETGTDPVDETLNAVWHVGNVDWSVSEVVLRLDYSNGTTTTLGTDSEYVTIDEQRFGADQVRLEDYPLGANDPATVDPSIDIVTEDGVNGGPDAGEGASPVRNPTFNGDIPGLQHLKISTLTPQAGGTVNISASPAAASRWGGLKQVNVTGPGCTRSVNAAEDEASVGLCNDTGEHRFELVIENPDGTQFREIMTLNAHAVSRARPPTIRTKTSPLGRYVIASDGLAGGDIKVENGGQNVNLVAIADTGDIPNSVSAHTTGMDVADDATISVRVVEGDSRQTVRNRIGVTLHTKPAPDGTLYYRNGDPIPFNEQHPKGSLKPRNGQLVYDTFTDDTGTVTLRQNSDPSITDRIFHWVGLNLPDIPLLSLAGSDWLLLLAPLVAVRRKRRPPNNGPTEVEA